MNKISKFRKGFTLIELMVVIAIIGILATVVVSSLNTARAKGRDTKRISDIHQIQNALELYYNTNGVYPAAGAGWSESSVIASPWTTVLEPLLTAYIPKLPLDPLNSGRTYTLAGYDYGYYSCNGSGYFLIARLETGPATKYSKGIRDCDAVTYNFNSGEPTYHVFSVGSDSK